MHHRHHVFLVVSFLLFQTCFQTISLGQQGVAIAVGLNSVDPAHYAGWSGPLVACEADANDMESIAQAQGFQVHKLLTAQATRAAVIGRIQSVATSLPANGILVLSYSGHGGQVTDTNGDEVDGKDETWCLYDGAVTDDELAQLWTTFKPGVRVVVFSDSCHSGTVTRFRNLDRLVGVVGFDGPPGNEEATSKIRARSRTFISATEDDTKGSFATKNRNATPSAFRAMPNDVAAATYEANKEFYDRLGKSAGDEHAHRRNTSATIMLISGCQDNQLSADGTNNGLFTGTLKLVWNNGGFSGGYDDFHASILSMMPPYQSPNYFVFGTSNPTFEQQKPYTR